MWMCASSDLILVVKFNSLCELDCTEFIHNSLQGPKKVKNMKKIRNKKDLHKKGQ